MTIPPAIQQLVDRVLQWPPVVKLQQILAAFNEAGGGLLAAGLAYSALFAALTGLLFTVGLLQGRGDLHQPLVVACAVLSVAAFAVPRPELVVVIEKVRSSPASTTCASGVLTTCRSGLRHVIVSPACLSAKLSPLTVAVFS